METPLPNPGQAAPDPGARFEDGTDLNLSNLRGHWLVLYFYPRDNTPGCTREAQQFRDLKSEFSARKVSIIGISRDSARSHKNFARKHALHFILIADTDESWCRAYDVIHEKMLYGKRHRGVVRSTFLIDPEGTIFRVWTKVSVAGHAQEILDAIPVL